MAADISASAIVCADGVNSVGFTTTDADPATGSVATDSAITKAIIVRAKRIIVLSDAKIHLYQRPWRQVPPAFGRRLLMNPI